MSSGGYHHGNLRQACLKVGLKLLKRKGPDDFSLRDVARQLDVSPGAPYRHFASKEALLADLATNGFERLRKQLARANETEQSPLDQLRSMGREFYTFAEKNPDVFRLMFSGRIKNYADYPQLQAAGNQAFAMLQDCVDRGQAAGYLHDENARTMAIHALAMLYGYSMLVLNRRLDSAPPKSPARFSILGQLTEQMMSGIARG